jgi:AraC-like DNA-binding protein
MGRDYSGIAVGRLERSCRARIRLGAAGFGIERAEAFFRHEAFAPHRHDRYAIGVTLSGVQTFRYRGAVRHCLPGELHVLHPDEVHDGAPATEAGFGYRIVYVDPAAIGDCIGGRPLPFVRDPVVAQGVAPTPLIDAIGAVDEPVDEMTAAEAIATVAESLIALEGGEPPARKVDRPAVTRIRDLLAAAPESATTETAEAVSGLDRWTLARQFRAAFGTSPGRFRTMRRLDRVRDLIRSGAGLADAAVAAGFADQSHMSRQFKRAFGLTPARWASATRAGISG